MTREERIPNRRYYQQGEISSGISGAKNILLFEDGFVEHYRRWIIPSDDWMFQFGRGKNLKQITMYARKI